MRKALIYMLLSVVGCSYAIESTNNESDFSSESFLRTIVTTSNDQPCDSVVSSYCSDKVLQNQKQSTMKFNSNGANLPIDSNGSNGGYIDFNNYKFDQNAVANFNITNSNQTALQSYAPIVNNGTASPSEMIRNNLSVPIKTGNNSSIQVMPDKVEFNLKY